MHVIRFLLVCIYVVYSYNDECDDVVAARARAAELPFSLFQGLFLIASKGNKPNVQFSIRLLLYSRGAWGGAASTVMPGAIRGARGVMALGRGGQFGCEMLFKIDC